MAFRCSGMGRPWPLAVVLGFEPATAEPPLAPTAGSPEVVIVSASDLLGADVDFVLARARIGGFRDEVRVLPRIIGAGSLPFLALAIFGNGMSSFTRGSDTFVLVVCGFCLVGVTRSIT